MILPPFAAPVDLVIAMRPNSDGVEQWYIFSQERLLVNHESQKLPDHNPFANKDGLYMGSHEKKHLYVAKVNADVEAPEGWGWSELGSLFGKMRDEHFAIAGRALQLLDWDLTNKYCGRCAAETVHRFHERCRECPKCGYLAYPKLTPAVVALVRRENKILLARGAHYPDNMYTILAGFVDPGETLEQTVEREISEEVGLKVANIRYFGSQPWPFSRSLMIAFTCDWERGKIRIDSNEIEEADWYDKGSLPKLPPPLSISRILIDSVLSTIE